MNTPSEQYALLVDVLQRASSQNAKVLKPAEAKLREWETQPGFYSTLFSIISNHSLDINVRWMAVLYIKNGIDKYWRKNAPNAISEQEKLMIRQGLISSFNEPVNQIATQRAVLVSKVARIDCPREWPELFPTLLTAVESPDCLVQHRVLLTLHHAVKALSSRRLAGDRKIFQELASNIYDFTLNLWNNFTEAFLSSISQNATSEVIIRDLEKALLTLRILRKLTVYGFNKAKENQRCIDFMKVIFDKAKRSLEGRKHLQGKGIYVLELCEKYITHLTKVLISVLDSDPFSFVELIQPTLEFTMFYLFTSEGITFVYERFVIQCFNLIKNILLCAEFKVNKLGDKFSECKPTMQAHEIKTNFFQPNVLREICQNLVSHYFLLTQDELYTWDADPEAFANDESGDSWKYSLRPSMETVFITIFHEFRDVLAPVLLEMIQENYSLVSPEDMQGILKKDAVYNAVGLANFDLYDEVDFDQWFKNTLIQELKVKHHNYRIIRRRVSALIARWTGIKLSPELRPELYQCIINLLGPDEDMAVRLTASTTLRCAIDDFDFNSEQFKDYLEPAFNLLFDLLKEVSECETKMHVLNVMTLMVQQVGHTIQPHSDALIHYLPLLWRESEEHNMLRCAIVATLVQLVRALGTVVSELNPFLLPIIKLGTDTQQSAIVYLLEDSLELWLTVLEHSSVMTNEFMEMFNNMPALLDYSTENLRLCLQICLVHTLLAPETVMRLHGVLIMSVCDNLMADLRYEGIMTICRVVDTFLRVVPSLGAETVRPVLPRIFNKIYEGEEYPMIMSTYITIMSRVLLSSHPVFTQTLSTLAQMHNENDQVTLAKVLDVWLSKMVNVSQMEQRKLLALALTNLLTTQSVPVLERIGRIMIQILETLNDITKTDENGVAADSLLLMEGQSPSHFSDDSDNYYETEHDRRKKQLILIDPVHTISLKEYLQSQMMALKNQLGPTHYENLLHSVDADTISQLKDYYITF